MKKQFKFEDGKLLVAERQKFNRTEAGVCPFCKLPVFVSQGQLLRHFNGQPTHKKCR